MPFSPIILGLQYHTFSYSLMEDEVLFLRVIP